MGHGQMENLSKANGCKRRSFYCTAKTLAYGDYIWHMLGHEDACWKPPVIQFNSILT